MNELLTSDTSAPANVSIDARRDVCVLPFSSGTTGVPKGVMLSHFNIVSNILQATEVPENMQYVKQCSGNSNHCGVSRETTKFHLFHG